MNLPNKLTLMRIIMVPFYICFLLLPVPHHYLIAFIIFAAAAYTDHLDGKIARKRGLITDFGKFADPLADKIMILAALACFVQLGLTNAVVLTVIVSREFMVTALRLVASSSGKVVAANSWGKAKTISQIAAVLLVMLLQYILELAGMGIIHLNDVARMTDIFRLVGEIAIWISAVFTIISGVIYMVQNFEFIKNAK